MRLGTGSGLGLALEPRGSGLAQCVLVDGEVGRAQRDHSGYGARLVDGAEHEGVEGLEDDHLVPLVQEGQEDGRERLQRNERVRVRTRGPRGLGWSERVSAEIG